MKEEYVEKILEKRGYIEAMFDISESIENVKENIIKEKLIKELLMRFCEKHSLKYLPDESNEIRKIILKKDKWEHLTIFFDLKSANSDYGFFDKNGKLTDFHAHLLKENVFKNQYFPFYSQMGKLGKDFFLNLYDNKDNDVTNIFEEKIEELLSMISDYKGEL